MTPVNNILDVLPIKTPEKKAQQGRQTDDFLSRLDRAAQSADAGKANRAESFAGRGNKKMQAAEAKPVEMDKPVDEAIETESGKPEETNEVLPDVFAVIPIFSSEVLTADQTPVENVEAVLTLDAAVEAAPEWAAAELLSTMDVPEAEITLENKVIAPEAEITLENKATAPEAEITIEQPKTQEKPIQNAQSVPVGEQPEAELKEPEADKQAKVAESVVEQTKPAVPQAKPEVAESKAENFAKQAMQEVSEALKKQEIADSQKTVTPQNIAEEQEAMVTKSLTASEDGDGADASAKQKETPTNTQQPMTAQIAQDGKVEFKESMQELRPEQQFQLRQNVQSQIVDQVRSLVTKEKTEFFLQLKPEHLGGLSIMLAAGEKGLIAKLVTGSKDVHMMIQNDATQIQESLKERGINVVQMEVVYDQMSSATGRQDTNNNGQGFEPNGSGGSQGRLPEDAIEGIEMPAYTGELSNYDILAEQGGSVEFSA